MDTCISDVALEEFRDLVEQVDQGVKRGRIPFDKVMRVLKSLQDEYPVAALHLIDCDADPFLPEGLSVDEADQLPHRARGLLEWNPSKVALYLSNEQKHEFVKGEDLKRDLAFHPVLPANVLDYLLAHPHLIPEAWKDKSVFFWGTIYRDREDKMCVRFLYWHVGRWFCNQFWLECDWNDNCPAALRA
ncbi:MAG: hypothetical protein HY452_02345 [Parcubacteria group bacterium]|nr:hypothetical protein [Parcubacteria group bacterium]